MACTSTTPTTTAARHSLVERLRTSVASRAGDASLAAHHSTQRGALLHIQQRARDRLGAAAQLAVRERAPFEDDGWRGGARGPLLGDQVGNAGGHLNSRSCAPKDDCRHGSVNMGAWYGTIWCPSSVRYLHGHTACGIISRTALERAALCN
jgi:hypothetical protein